MEFNDWLIQKKGYSEKSAKDVLSRQKRACKLVHKEEISQVTLQQLEKSSGFNDLSTSVKSQLRRAVRLNAIYREEMK